MQNVVLGGNFFRRIPMTYAPLREAVEVLGRFGMEVWLAEDTAMDIVFLMHGESILIIQGPTEPISFWDHKRWVDGSTTQAEYFFSSLLAEGGELFEYAADEKTIEDAYELPWGELHCVPCGFTVPPTPFEKNVSYAKVLEMKLMLMRKGAK